MDIEERKKCHWFKKFFECLNKLTIHIIIDPKRQWNCPACKGGLGAIRWFTRPKTCGVDERNVSVIDLRLNSNKNDECLVCARKLENKGEKHYMDDNSTCGHPIIQKFELCNNVRSSNQLDLSNDECNEDGI
ncbi:hypothetical protein H5410_041244 [Solanum commersonii]|uniref:Uncharacterized protein n=1 Tax=Solanum commersonii TaxID=4109 RepID=A0A9J5XSH1_SOLCO|nr:hypothetical protein H5410_041244 [Solanum commersonii]